MDLLLSYYVIKLLLNYFSSWRIVSFCVIGPSCIVLLAMIALPETPYWLIENNHFEKAKKSLQFFRGTNYDITYEIDEIQQKHLSKQKYQSTLWTLRRLCSRAFFKPFMCIGILELLWNVSGFEVLTLYMVPVLKETESIIEPNLGPVIVGGVRVVVAGLLTLYWSTCNVTFICISVSGKEVFLNFRKKIVSQ